ncbi:MAG: hypothetical protein GC161_09245 [Planctomycetaceae bacterium]|nr:hypothetical protein [Planctomycetaceae bacterium]
MRSYFAALAPEEHKAGYTQLLTSLSRGPSDRPQVPPQGMAYLEKNRVSPADVLGIAAAAPREEDGSLAKASSALLGTLLAQAFDAGHQIESFLGAYRPRLDEAEAPLSRRDLARVLVAANQPLHLDGLLPTAEAAIAEDDREALNLIARHVLARHADDGNSEWLESAWTVTLAALAAGDVAAETKEEALKRAVELAPKLREDLGQAWLEESFTSRPERGMEIVAAIGASTAQALSKQPMDSAGRLALLGLQSTSAEALLEAAPERAAAWARELDLLASNWLREAVVTYQLDQSTRRGPGMQRDVYGNVFYFDGGGFSSRQNQVQAIPTGKVLELRPGDNWLDCVGETLRPRLHMVMAQLLLKVSEETEAFPHIERVATSDPRSAKVLVDEFLRVWARNHNPNEMGRRANQYVFFFGFEERASGIPLTRSKQERNLEDLAGWVARLRGLPVELDDTLVVEAFRAAHSTAEVYRVETLERIFGSLDQLEPATLASLMQQMRQNLATIWRDPAMQENSGTNRRQRDIQAEVLRGYELARETVSTALADHPKSHELTLAFAALAHDENNFRQELGPDSGFSARRTEAFGHFERAAQLYAEALDSLQRDDESVDVYDTWFQAALGACDLKEIDPKHVLVKAQVEAVRAALFGLPEEARQRHVDRIASQLFARMSALNPGVKFRFVREALGLVGDHELAREARDLYEYYADLVTEIELLAEIDGSDEIGHGAPFGLWLSLHHTAAIERESGGFAKYLANQNAGNFGFNYGRPTEDYRDKFEAAARETLGEHFRVLSVTFNDPKAHSVATERYGWRRTTYAYVLLEPRGPEVDAIPSLRLDLDFLDTTGYAVLPVESAVLPIDCKQPGGTARPFERLALTQLLDERQARSGKLLLELKATAVGLAPGLEGLLDPQIEGFELVERQDNGVAVTQFDPEGEGVLSERTFTLQYRAAEGLEALPTRFTFPAVAVEGAEVERFRYEDADLVPVGATVDLERRYGEVSGPSLWWLALVPVALIGAGLWMRRRRTQTAPVAVSSLRPPERLTPFTVLAYLRALKEHNGHPAPESRELALEIDRLERHFFAEGADPEPDLVQVTRRWSGAN